MKNIIKFLLVCLLINIIALGSFSQTEASQIPTEFSSKIILAEKLDYKNKVPTISTGAFFMNTTYNIIEHSGYIQKDWMYGALSVDVNKGKEFKVNVEPLVIHPTNNGNMSVVVKKSYKEKEDIKSVESEIIFSSFIKNENRETTFSVNGQTKIEGNKIKASNYHWRTSDMVKEYRQLVYKYYEDESRMSFIVLSPFCLLPDKES